MSITTGSIGDDGLIDFRLLFFRLMRRRWWVLASVATCTAVFAAIAFLMTPAYRATTILAPATESNESSLNSALGRLGDLAALAGLGLQGAAAQTEEAIAVLKSREFTEHFIRDKNLMPKLFANKWDPVTKTWHTRFSKPPTLAKAYKYFDEHVRSVIPDKKTGLIALQIDWRDRQEAAEWANELVERLNEEMRQRAIAKADASVRYLEREANRTSAVVIQDAISRLMETQIKQRMLANVTREYAFRVVDKALPPDEDDPVRPQKLVLIVAGMLLGVMVGVGGALLSTPQ